MPIVPLEALQQFAAVNVLRDPGYNPGKHVIPNVMDVVLVFTLQDLKTAHIVCHARYTAGFPGNVAMANSLLSGFQSAWSSNLGVYMHISTIFSAVQLRDRGALDQPIIASTGATAAGGDSGSPALPNEVAAVITLRTALAGKSNRGRMYVPGWTGTALAAGNVIIAGAVTGLGAFGTAVRAQINATPPLTMVIALPSRLAYTSPKPPFTAHPARDAGSVDVTAAVVRDNHWDSQRRRGLK